MDNLALYNALVKIAHNNEIIEEVDNYPYSTSRTSQITENVRIEIEFSDLIEADKVTVIHEGEPVFSIAVGEDCEWMDADIHVT